MVQKAPLRRGCSSLLPGTRFLSCVPTSGHTQAESCVKLPCLLLAQEVLRAPGGVENPSSVSKTWGGFRNRLVCRGGGQVERETGHQSQIPREGTTPGGRWGGDGGPMQPGDGAPCPGRAPAGDPLRGGLACPGCGCQDRAQLAVPGPALWGNRIPWRNQRAVSESAFLPCASDPRLCLWAWRRWGFRPWVYLGVT